MWLNLCHFLCLVLLACFPEPSQPPTHGWLPIQQSTDPHTCPIPPHPYLPQEHPLGYSSPTLTRSFAFIIRSVASERFLLEHLNNSFFHLSTSAQSIFQEWHQKASQQVRLSGFIIAVHHVCVKCTYVHMFNTEGYTYMQAWMWQLGFVKWTRAWALHHNGIVAVDPLVVAEVLCVANAAAVSSRLLILFAGCRYLGGTIAAAVGSLWGAAAAIASRPELMYQWVDALRCFYSGLDMSTHVVLIFFFCAPQLWLCWCQYVTLFLRKHWASVYFYMLVLPSIFSIACMLSIWLLCTCANFFILTISINWTWVGLFCGCRWFVYYSLAVLVELTTPILCCGVLIFCRRGGSKRRTFSRMHIVPPLSTVPPCATTTADNNNNNADYTPNVPAHCPSVFEICVKGRGMGMIHFPVDLLSSRVDDVFSFVNQELAKQSVACPCKHSHVHQAFNVADSYSMYLDGKPISRARSTVLLFDLNVTPHSVLEIKKCEDGLLGGGRVKGVGDIPVGQPDKNGFIKIQTGTWQCMHCDGLFYNEGKVAQRKRYHNCKLRGSQG